MQASLKVVHLSFAKEAVHGSTPERMGRSFLNTPYVNSIEAKAVECRRDAGVTRR